MSWAHYILQVNIYLIVFYGFYKLLLDRETYFILNRLYLLSAGTLSAALPFLRFEWFITQPLAQPMYSSVGQMNDFITGAIVDEDVSKLTLGNVLAFLYVTGVIFFVVRLIIQLISVKVILREKNKGFAFSFFGKKVIDVTLPEFRTINSHEELHIKQLHSLDVIFFEVLGILTWFNPVIYFYKHSIKNIHEFLADEEAARFQGDKEQYALLLLSSAFGVTPSNLTNSFFNKSLIKKRIYMLHKQRSQKTAVLKYGLFLPLFAIALVMSSATIRKNEKILAIAEKIPLTEPLEMIKEAAISVTAENLGSNALLATVHANTSTARLAAQEAGNLSTINWSGLTDHLKRSIRYPTAAILNQTQGSTLIKFSVKGGEPEGVSLGGPSLGAGTDAEVMSKILSYADFKGVPDGKYTLKTTFTIAGATEVKKNTEIDQPEGYSYIGEIVIRSYLPKTTNTKNDPADIKVYDFVSLEAQPTFPGGMANFYNYLKQNVKYPAEAKANKVEGKVFLSFIVEKDGSLMDIKVDRKLGGGTDEEAVRVLTASPNWNPGVQNGNVVRVKYNIPISFSLNSSPATLGSAVDHMNLVAKQISNFAASPTQEEKVLDFTALDVAPTFPGGIKQFYVYLGKATKYPKEAQEKNIQGKVFTSFVVEKNGKLTNIKVDKGLGSGIDEEAIRVLNESPHWIPGMVDKKPVRVKYNLPLTFSLSK
ncbi:MAG: M56 family metallopeptidase [Pedobacter sp.]